MKNALTLVRSQLVTQPASLQERRALHDRNRGTTAHEHQKQDSGILRKIH